MPGAAVVVVVVSVAAVAAVMVQGHPMLHYYSGLKHHEDDHVVSVEEPVAQTTEEGPASNNLPPIVFVPGLTSAALDVELNNAPSLFGCPHTTEPGEPLRMWPAQINSTKDYFCFLENLKMWYDPISNQLHNRKGEKVLVEDWGGFEGLPLFRKVYTPLVKKGYVIGKNLFGAPFDWRGPARTFPDFFANMTKTIESAYAQNNNRKVAIIAASYGPQFVLAFLHRQSQAWKDKYIHWFIAESPVWSGCPASLLSLVSGYDVSNGTLSLMFSRQVAMETASSFWLLPRAGTTNTTWGKDEPIAFTPSRNYTSSDYKQLMTDIGFGFRTPAMEYTVNDTDLKDFEHPGVNTYVTYGYNLDTPGTFVWDEDFVHNITGAPPYPRVFNATDTGDGIVPVRSSMRAWHAWQDDMKQAKKTLMYKGYNKQQHALCILSTGSGASCWHEVFQCVW
ncbi:hypothetical protein PTSG_10314 [Salpingoeca rosetta]|uniref:Lecithin:cholesterol acyltransferase n=1 Tax=Salpingoeca rosetta (strain ATCC 50818 / BSB-021) TaxID=946362 RepID=F2UQY5_SALR5|nr:uncharacterized protein PTSG_10314 [Salpingoeca rosetta]EGD80040.1 hypothetical protein PTSG_10314 [Salpingoeca rosetta]|eukprot:XP_004988365.1 hypothetical protein PTSG_10314 [Salpingoeca rosetta]